MAQMEDFMFKLKLCVLWLNFINCYYVFSWSTRWILKLSRSFSDCFKSFSNTSFRSKGAVTSLKWSYNQYVACYYNQYARWIHCMRIFVFVVIRLKFLTWASKPTGLSPPIVLSCSDWLPFEKVLRVKIFGPWHEQRPHLCHRRVQRWSCSSEASWEREL